MKITAIEVLPLTGGTVDGGWPQGHEPQEELHTLLRIHTDGNITGVGSCFTSGALVAASMKLLWPMLKHQSAEEPTRVSETLHQATFWQGRGGAVTHTISGIDVALWDIMGQHCAQPVSRLLGGNFRDRIQPYGSMLFDDPSTLPARLEDVISRGFRAVKLGWRPFGRVSRQLDEQLIRQARRIVGDDITLMVDAGGSEQFWPHGLRWALQTAHMLADYNVAWFEEPLPPDDLAGYTELTRRSPVPIAAGEVLTRRQAFLPWLQQHACDIVQPDVTKCGGLSEFLRVARTAEDHNIHVVPHGWNTVVGLAADLQIAAILPNASFVEYLTPCAYVEELAVETPSPDADGLLRIPTRPGLGIELCQESLDRFCSGRILFQ